MGTADKKDRSGGPSRWQDEPPSPRVLKLALIAAAIILLIGVLLYLKARHAPPAMHDELLPNALVTHAVCRA